MLHEQALVLYVKIEVPFVNIIRLDSMIVDYDSMGGKFMLIEADIIL